MNKLVIALISVSLSTAAFAQVNGADAPGREKPQGQSAKTYAPGQEKPSGQSAKAYAPDQDKNKGQTKSKTTSQKNSKKQ